MTCDISCDKCEFLQRCGGEIEEEEETERMCDSTCAQILNLSFYIAYGGLLTSVAMDSILWLVCGYLIPCWTMAAMSLGLILLIFVLQKLMKGEKNS